MEGLEDYVHKMKGSDRERLLKMHEKDSSSLEGAERLYALEDKVKYRYP